MILDIVGAPYLQKNCEAIAQDGRIVLIGWMGGMQVKDWDMQILVKKRISLIGARLLLSSPSCLVESHACQRVHPQCIGQLATAPV